MWTGSGPCTEDAWQNCLRMTPHLHLVSAPHVLPTHFLPVAWQYRGLMPICSYCFLWQPVLCMQYYQPISYLCNFITCSFPFTWSNRMNEEASRKRRELLAHTSYGNEVTSNWRSGRKCQEAVETWDKSSNLQKFSVWLLFRPAQQTTVKGERCYIKI